jgi:Yip1 domain
MTQLETAAISDQGVWARAIGIIVSPGATFERVVRWPRPATILLLSCAVMALATGLPQFTERGRQASVDMQAQQVERMFGTPLTPEQYTQLEQRARFGPYIAFVGVFVAVPVLCLVFAGLYWVVFNTVLGGTASYKQVLAVITHSQVIAALGAVVSAPIQYIQGTQTAAGPFNLGALAPMLEPGSLVASFLGAISFFTLWSLIVTAIGLAALYRRRSGTIAGVLVGVYLAAVAVFTIGLSSLRGR